MVQRFISYVMMLILTVLIVLGVIFMGLFYDKLGIITLPAEVKAVLAWRPQPVTIRVESQRSAEPVWSNPLEDMPVWTPPVLPSATSLPTAEPTETPWPTATPIPPLDPAVYRTEVMLRLKNLAAELEQWMDLNEELARNWSLLDDPTWQATMQTSLRNIRTTGWMLGDVTPPPPEYAGIQALLEQAGGEAQSLADHYAQAMQTRDMAQFTAAGDSFKRMKAYLAEAVNAMLDAGWEIQ